MNNKKKSVITLIIFLVIALIGLILAIIGMTANHNENWRKLFNTNNAPSGQLQSYVYGAYYLGIFGIIFTIIILIIEIFLLLIMFEVFSFKIPKILYIALIVFASLALLLGAISLGLGEHIDNLTFHVVN